jgi:hypothetical protein
MPLVAAARDLAGRDAAAGFASTWDSYDRLLRSAAAANTPRVVLAAQTNPGGIERYSSDPNFWTNRCAANYYGVEIEAFDPPPALTPADRAHLITVEAEIGGVARLLGYRLSATHVHPGEQLDVTLYWLPLAHTIRPHTVFVHLLHPVQGSLAQADAYPGQGRYPTTLWLHRRPFADTYTLQVPEGALAGASTVVVGLYELESLQRLPVTGADAGPAGEGWAQLGRVTIGPE